MLPLSCAVLGYLGCGESFTSSSSEFTDASADSPDAGPDGAADGQAPDAKPPDGSDGSDGSADASPDAAVDAADTDASEAGPDAGFPVCTAGEPGTIDRFTASGPSGAGVLVHFHNFGSEDYGTISPAQADITGLPLPGQLVIAGKDGFQFHLWNGASDFAKPWYKAGNLPTEQCGDVDNFQTEACLSATAKSFRCQFSPYLETSDCPVLPVHFTDQGSASSHSEAAVGWVIILIDLSCP
jgi:hypothetical protein